MIKLREEEIWQKIKKRESLLARNVLLEEAEMTRQQEQLQKEHQKVLFWESQAKEEKKEKFNELRREIERQQQEITKPLQVAYQSTALQFIPPQTVVKNTIMAFLVGGIICSIGQIINGYFLQGGLGDREAAAATSSLLIFSGAFFTGLGYYDKLGEIAGAGSIVPITGFANSIVSSGLEYKREGYIYGVGAHLFTVAGPVLVYGIMLSIMVGLVHYFVK